MRAKDLFGLAILFVFALPPKGHAQCLAPPTMGGVWIGNDGGTYRINDIRRFASLHPPAPRDVWWVGSSADNGKTFVNVFRGVRRGNVVTGDWSDVRGPGSGTLELFLEFNPSGPAKGRLAAIRKTGGSGSIFGGSEWRPACDDTTSTPQ
ncbi:MAG: hypothetical protein QOF14_1834 [Hyphomicrobiales bacterium]|jgi:hypothetical protein|nr:hypothetical protein [Hyphomicrobiales bacterium]